MLGLRRPPPAAMLIPLRDDNPTTITPVVTYTVIGACVALWLLTLGEQTHRAVTFGFGYIPVRSFHDAVMPQGVATLPWPLTLLSYQFLHGGFLHLAGNMLYLWIFANNVEEAMGHARFLLFYLATGVFAALAHALTDTASAAPLVGASGAIFGLFGVAFVFQRQTGIDPWRSGVGALIGINLVLTFAIPGISISGHIGGLVGGALAALAVFEIEERTRSTAASLAVCGAMSAALVLGCLWAAQQFAHPLLG